MYVLTLRQPWAWLLVTGRKRIETRSWRTRVRQPIAIHASGDITEEEVALCSAQPFSDALAETGIVTPDMLPLGQVIGRVNLTDCQQMGIEFPLTETNLQLNARERAFGVYAPGRWAWQTSSPVLYAERNRVALRGMPGLWKIDGDVLLGRRAQDQETAP